MNMASVRRLGPKKGRETGRARGGPVKMCPIHRPFELTFPECEAYITPSGAPSAYGAIARL